MYTVLLADDEQAVLDTLISTIPWPQLGVDRVLTASDGISAITQMEKAAVDLLITDIRMPHMNGLQLIEKARERCPYVRCILLTAHSEFEYAKKGLQLGVENYILKPFQQDELERTIEKALDNLYSEKDNGDRIFRDNILIRWVNNDINPNELSERALYLNINIYHKKYCVICINKLLKCSLGAYLEKIRGKIGDSMEFQHFWNNTGLCVLIVGGGDLSLDFLKTIFLDTSDEMNYHGAIIAAAGPMVNGSENVFQSYHAAYELIRTVDENVTDLFILPQSSENLFKDSYRQRLNTLFKISDNAQRMEGYQLFSAQLYTAAHQDAKSAFAILTHSLFQLFEQEYPNRPEVHKQLYNSIRLSSIVSDNFADTSVRLLENGYLLSRFYYEQLSPVIQLAVKYIHKHYPESLSLKEFCVKNKMNTAYLGYLFKKETGMFFNNYLEQYRICNSLQLLEETQMQVTDIAGAVGFSSISYFTTCFKKQTGFSPAKYRSLHV